MEAICGSLGAYLFFSLISQVPGRQKDSFQYKVVGVKQTSGGSSVVCFPCLQISPFSNRASTNTLFFFLSFPLKSTILRHKVLLAVAVAVIVYKKNNEQATAHSNLLLLFS